MSGYIGTQPVPQATQTRDVFTATSAQTIFATSGYTPGYVDVWLNGVKLVNGDDFTATNGSDVVLTTGATAGDTVEVLAFSTFTPSDAATAAQGALADSAVQPNDSVTLGTVTFDVVKVASDISPILGTPPDAVLSRSDVDIFGDGSLVQSVLNYSVTGSYGGGGTHLFKSDGTTVLEVYSGGAAVTGTVTASGGVYLGGTGAANLLDDYEEGTWTPSFSSGSWGTQSNLTYTKIGRFVHITGYLAAPSGISSSILTISGLPFTGNASYQMAPLWYNGISSVIAMAYLPGNSTGLQVRPIGGGPNTFTELSVQMTYITNQ